MFIDLITKNPKIKEKCEEHGLYMEEKHWTLVQGIIKGEGQYSKQYLYQVNYMCTMYLLVLCSNGMIACMYILIKLDCEQQMEWY